LSKGSITAEPPVVAAPPGFDPAGRARYLTGALFLGPALKK